MSRISGDTVGDGYVYDCIVRDARGRLRLYSQDCHVDENGYIVADHDPVDLTDSVDEDGLAGWANTWTLDSEHGDPGDCIVGPGETLVAHRLMRNAEIDVR
jgi:hypothetical protein